MPPDAPLLLLPHGPDPLAELLPELASARNFAAASKADETQTGTACSTAALVGRDWTRLPSEIARLYGTAGPRRGCALTSTAKNCAKPEPVSATYPPSRERSLLPYRDATRRAAGDRIRLTSRSTPLMRVSAWNGMNVAPRVSAIVRAASLSTAMKMEAPGVCSDHVP